MRVGLKAGMIISNHLHYKEVKDSSGTWKVACSKDQAPTKTALVRKVYLRDMVLEQSLKPLHVCNFRSASTVA